MATKLREAGSQEVEAVKTVKDAVLKRIRDGVLTKEEIAQRLGLLPIGVEFLLKQEWSLETAWRVAEYLGLNVRLQV